MRRSFKILVLLLLPACAENPASIPIIDAAIDAASYSDASVDAEVPRPRRIYVSVGQQARIAVVELGVDGSLTAESGLDLSLNDNPGAMTFARQARRLYVGMRPQSIVTISVDGLGQLELLGETTATGFPVYLGLAHEEAVLVSAYFGDDRIKTHGLAAGPPHAELDSVASADEPHAAYVDATDSRVYVPHRNGNVVHWYNVSSDGDLILSSQLAAEPGMGPRHITMHPAKEYAYVIHEFGDSISAHRVLAEGVLERFQSISTIPEEFPPADNACADIHITPDGRFVYASNRGHDSIAMFSVGQDGSLTSLGTTATEARPREFSISPDGRHLVVAGQDSGFLHSYRIGEDGVLTSVQRIEVGPDLRWAIID